MLHDELGTWAPCLSPGSCWALGVQKIEPLTGQRREAAPYKTLVEHPGGGWGGSGAGPGPPKLSDSLVPHLLLTSDRQLHPHTESCGHRQLPALIFQCWCWRCKVLFSQCRAADSGARGLMCSYPHPSVRDRLSRHGERCRRWQRAGAGCRGRLVTPLQEV